MVGSMKRFGAWLGELLGYRQLAREVSALRDMDERRAAGVERLIYAITELQDEQIAGFVNLGIKLTDLSAKLDNLTQVTAQGMNHDSMILAELARLQATDTVIAADVARLLALLEPQAAKLKRSAPLNKDWDAVQTENLKQFAEGN